MSNRRKKYTEDEIIRILKEAEATGKVAETLRKYGANDTSYYRWKEKYAGVEGKELLRLRQLQAENETLKKVIANQALDIQMLKDINSKNW